MFDVDEDSFGTANNKSYKSCISDDFYKYWVINTADERHFVYVITSPVVSDTVLKYNYRHVSVHTH